MEELQLHSEGSHSLSPLLIWTSDALTNAMLSGIHLSGVSLSAQ